MARIEYHSSCPCLVAGTDDEAELIRHGQLSGGHLVLMEALYPVVDDAVLLPQSISACAAARAREALEQAASSHRRARRQRARFQLIKK